MTDTELIKALAERLGGFRQVAEALGIHRTRPYNWSREAIPRDQRAAVYMLAQREGIDLDAGTFLRLPSGILVVPQPQSAETA